MRSPMATVGISGVSLHSYRYAWAERAKVAGMPERYAQQALGHSSKAFARSYSKNAIMVVPSLETYERKIAPSGSGPELTGSRPKVITSLSQGLAGIGHFVNLVRPGFFAGCFVSANAG